MKKLILGLALAASFLVTACSNQWRESNVDVSDEDVFSIYSELSTSANLPSGFTEDTSSTVFFAQSGAFGSPNSLFSFSDLTFLGSSYSNVASHELGMSEATVIFADGMGSDGQRYFSLMLKLQTDGASTAIPFAVTSAAGDYSFDNDAFAVRFAVNGGTLILRSNDIDATYSDELASAIHLKAFMVYDGDSTEYSIGQISILKGYGGIQ